MSSGNSCREEWRTWELNLRYSALWINAVDHYWCSILKQQNTYKNSNYTTLSDLILVRSMYWINTKFLSHPTGKFFVWFSMVCLARLSCSFSVHFSQQSFDCACHVNHNIPRIWQTQNLVVSPKYRRCDKPPRKHIINVDTMSFLYEHDSTCKDRMDIWSLAPPTSWWIGPHAPQHLFWDFDQPWGWSYLIISDSFGYS